MSGSPFPVLWAGRHAAITLPAEIDIANVRQADHEISALIAQQPAILVLDMTGTRFCDSSGIAALIRAAKQAAALHITVRLAATGPVTRMIRLAGIDKVIATYPTLDAALGSPAPSPPSGPDTGNTAR